MKIFWENAESFSGTPKKGRSKISAKIWPSGSEVLDPLVTYMYIRTHQNFSSLNLSTSFIKTENTAFSQILHLLLVYLNLVQLYRHHPAIQGQWRNERRQGRAAAPGRRSKGGAK